MTLTSIVVALIALIAGWAIGFFDSNMRSSQKIKAAEAKADAAVKDAEIKNAQANQRSQAQQDDPGLLRLKNENGQIKFEMDGAVVENVLSAEKRKRLIELVTILRPWLEGGQPQQAVTPPATPVQTSRVPDPPQAVTPPLVPKPATQPLTPAAKKAEAEKSIAALSIVGQIDAVLQARLADSPLAKRGVRLQESALGEVEVYVGLDKFHSVDVVPDEAIKTAIRAAISEWEDKYTPGL